MVKRGTRINKFYWGINNLGYTWICEKCGTEYIYRHEAEYCGCHWKPQLDTFEKLFWLGLSIIVLVALFLSLIFWAAQFF